MRYLRWILGGFAALALSSLLLLVGYCTLGGPSSYRYKMTITVSTPQGMRSFSSVRAVDYWSKLEGGYAAYARGEAIVMDLPGGPVFALMSGADGDRDYAAQIGVAFRDDLEPGGANAGYRAGHFAEIFPTAPQISGYIPKDARPMLVRFGDITDPRSVERVDPDTIGVTRITLATTRDDVTTGIEKRLGWLDRLEDYQTDKSNPFTSTLASEIGGLREK